MPAVGFGEAREVLWNNQLVGWYETDWSLAIGGEKNAPLRVLFGSQATTPAVEAVIEALRISGPPGRRVGFELIAPWRRATASSP